ncbi:hypothetical protein F5H01DRAFT_352445 [Linnemannia elongata]|nr:hypothetical protein F5H01DRAFT_352445 [Linnemannia elongata]
MTATRGTGCDTVLNIQELQDMIRNRLALEDLKTCTLVSRQWNSYFDPCLWEKCTIWRRRQKRRLLKRHGIHVRRLSCLYFDRHTLTTILKYCPNIETLYLRLDEHSMWIQYHTLESLFLHLQHSLTNLHILFDATYFEPAFLWSVCRLTKLMHLRIDPYSLEDRDPGFSPPAYFLGLLECCPRLRGLTFVYGPYFGGDFGEDHHRWTRSTFKKWIRGLFDSRRQERIPASPHDAIAKITMRTGSGVKQGGAVITTNTHRVNPESPKPVPTLQQYNLRSLQLQPPAMDLPTLLRIVRQSPSMEILTLGGQWSNFHPDTTWTELSTYCSQIRELNIQFNGTIKDFPSIATLVTLFPRLESLSLLRQMFSKDPDLSTLGASLRKHRQQYGAPHPFKALEITGLVRQQFPIIVDALTLPVAMESIKVGNIIRYSRFIQEETPAAIPAQSTTQTQTPPTSGTSTSTLTTTTPIPWTCLDSLTTLDISSVVFPDHATTFHFFSRLQECNRLRTLHLWLFHLRDMISHVAFSKSDDSGEAPPPSSALPPAIDDDEDEDIIIINSSGSSTHSSTHSSHSSSTSSSASSFSVHPTSAVSSLSLSFPTLRTVNVAPVFELLRSGLGPGITIPEAKLLIAAMPSLVDLGLVSSAGESEVGRLQREFPALKIRM